MSNASAAVITSLDLVGEGGMSEDESCVEDDVEKSYVMTVPGRHPKVTELVRTIDAYSEANRLPVSRSTRRRYLRVPSSVGAELPAGFAEGVYDPAWLARLPEYHRAVITGQYKDTRLDLPAIEAFITELNSQMMDITL
jgi:hypothetical protein